MGYDLYGKGGHFHFNSQGWYSIQVLAQEHGWRPGGAGKPANDKKRSWEGSYLFNEGQRVLAKNARAMAAALERAYEQISSVDPPRKKVSITETDTYAGWGRPMLKKFIPFCKAGGFKIC